MDKSVSRIGDAFRELAHVPQMLRVCWALLADSRVPLWLKVCALGGAAYVASPLDVLPDEITGFAVLDDVILVALILQAFIESAPAGLVAEHCDRLGIEPEGVQVDVTAAVVASIGAVLPFIERARGISGAGSSSPRKTAVKLRKQSRYSNVQAAAAPTQTAAQVQAETAGGRDARYSAYSSTPQG